MKRNKNEQFIKLAETRTNKISSMLRLIGNLSNRANYEYSEEDVEKVFDHIQKELDKARRRFKRAEKKKRLFSLSEEIVEPVFQTDYPSITLTLPDDKVLRAKAIDDEDFPAIKVELLWNDKVETVCEVEYNPENKSPLGIGVCLYASGEEDQVGYFLYKEK